ncbi:MAG TPA: MaoC/PaaZ C-terminal domain-containing protein [Mycobacteriales bacterium]|jgi:acyl dehydratase|nr:MaoC/PaaZ C-terminal domain-containing protein [Mycobacteriales bacterium]
MSTPTLPDKRVVGPLTVTDFVRYQGASGDMNPIHHDESFAKGAGFPSVFAVGMLNAGLLGTYLTDWLGAKNVRRFQVQFRAQVWPGDELTFEVSSVSERTGDDGSTLLDVESVVTRQNGDVAIKGQATFSTA